MRELRQDWRDIFHGFRIALDPKKMLLGMIWGFLCVVVVMVTVTWLCEDGSPMRELVGETIRNPAGEVCRLVKACARRGAETEASAWAASEQRSAILYHGQRWLEGSSDWTTRDWLGVGGVVAGWILLGLLFWSWFGAPLLRLCGVQYARDETLSFNDACGFASGKRKSFFFAPLVPFAIVALMLVPVLIAGLAGRIPWIGPIGVALFLPLAIVTGLFVVLTLIGGIVGSCMMGPTIAVEGTDAFDAISRSFSYVYQRPWHFMWYWLVALAYGAACIVFVTIVAMLSVWVPLYVGGWAMGPKFLEIKGFLVSFYALPESFPLALAAILFKGWIILAYGFVLGFVVSFLATQQVIIYSLMRKRVDGTDTDEIYIEEDEEEFEPEEPAPATEEKEGEAEEAEQEPETEEEEGEEEERTEEEGGEEEEGEGEAEGEEEEKPEAETKKKAAKKSAKKKKKTTRKKKSTKKKSRRKTTKKKSSGN